MLRPVRRILVDLFQTIAEQESHVEDLRLQLAQCSDFKPRSLFNLIDEERNNKISVEELQQFMFDNFIKGVSDKVVCEIITEFDSDQDGHLTYDEFLNIFLPAANESVRKYVLYNKKQSSSTEVPPQVIKLATKILALEKEMATHKIDARKDLTKHATFNVEDAFKLIAGRYSYITLQQLTQFLEAEGSYYPKQAELEAIMRRCDHDADRMLCFQEFAELCENVENPYEESDYTQSYLSRRDMDEEGGASAAQGDQSRNWTMGSMRTPQKPEFGSAKSLKGAPFEVAEAYHDQEHLRKANPGSARSAKSSGRTKEKSQLNGRLQNLVQFTALLQKRLVMVHSLDMQRQLLFSHASFDAAAMFQQIDVRNKGYVDARDIQSFFEGFDPLNYSRIIEYLNATDDDGHTNGGERLSLSSFARGLRPYQLPKEVPYKQMKFKQQHQGQRMAEVGQNACREQLYQVFVAITNLLPNRMVMTNLSTLLQIWFELDTHHAGSVTISNFRRWLETETGVIIEDSQSHFLNDCFNQRQDDTIIAQNNFMAILN